MKSFGRKARIKRIKIYGGSPNRVGPVDLMKTVTNERMVVDAKNP